MPAIIIPKKQIHYTRPRWPFAVNRDSPQAERLVGWWPVTQPSSEIEVVRGLNGQNNGTLTWQTDIETLWTLDFDTASEAHILIPESLAEGDFTLSCIVRDPANSGGSRIFTWGENAVGGDNRDFLLQGVGGDIVLRYGEWDGISFVDVQGTVKLDDGNSHWVAVKKDGTTYTLYVDGLADGSTTINKTLTLDRMAIGTRIRDVAAGSFEDQITDVQLHDVALQDAVIYSKWDPSSRWNLAYELGRVFYSIPAVAQVIERTVQDSLLLTDVQPVREALRVKEIQDAIAELIDIPILGSERPRTIADLLILSDVSMRETSLLRSIADALGLEDIDLRSAERPRTAADAIVLSDADVRQAERPRTIADPLELSDAMDRKLDRTLLITDPLVLADLLIREMHMIVAEKTEMSDAQTLDREMLLVQILSLADSVTFHTERNRRILVDLLISDIQPLLDRCVVLADPLVLSDNVIATSTVIGKVVTRLAQDSLLLSDAFSRLTELTVAERMDLVDSLASDVLRLRILTDSLLLSDVTLRSAVRDRLSQSFLLLEDATIRLREITFLDQMPIADEVTKLIVRALVELLSGIKVRILDFLQTDMGTKDFLERWKPDVLDFLGTKIGVFMQEAP